MLQSVQSAQVLKEKSERLFFYAKKSCIFVFRHELEQYQKNLSTRPHAIIANKIDVDGSDEILNDFVSKLRKEISSEVPVIPVSAKMGQNISNLVAFFKTMHEKQTVQTINEEDSSTKFN